MRQPVKLIVMAQAAAHTQLGAVPEDRVESLFVLDLLNDIADAPTHLGQVLLFLQVGFFVFQRLDKAFGLALR